MQTTVQDTARRPVRIPFLFALVTVHLLALAAPFTFSWEGLIVFVVMSFATGCLGITLCYHRLLTHRSFKTFKPVKYFLMLCGTLAFEGDPTWWVATHRLHHRESDQPKDPHSPVQDGFFWAHMGWLAFDDVRMLETRGERHRYTPDLDNDPWARFLAKFFVPVNVLFLAGLFGLGYALGGIEKGISLFIWGGALRIAYVWHITWLINSATHMYGYRNYETKDDSRNCWWIALLSFGEGWHNNHHAMPSAAPAGHKWWEFDLTYAIIKLMKFTGLAWKIQPVIKGPAVIEALKAQLAEQEPKTPALQS